MPFKLLSNTLSFFVMSTKEAFDMLAVGWAAFADIDCYIEHSSLHAADKLGLGEWRALEMKAAHHTIG